MDSFDKNHSLDKDWHTMVNSVEHAMNDNNYRIPVEHCEMLLDLLDAVKDVLDIK